MSLASKIQHNEETLAGYGEAMTCELGDIDEYTDLRARLSERESMLARENAAVRRAEAAASLERLKVGDVIRVPAGRRAGVAVVVDPGFGNGFDTPVPTVLTIDRRLHRLSVVDVPTPVEPVGRVRIPKTFNVRSPRSRRDLASSLRNLDLPERPHRSRKGRAAGAPVPRLSRPRGTRAFGGGPSLAGAGHRGAAASGGEPDQLVGPHLRPGLRGSLIVQPRRPWNDCCRALDRTDRR